MVRILDQPRELLKRQVVRTANFQDAAAQGRVGCSAVNDPGNVHH
jgi:hypothetical protein